MSYYGWSFQHLNLLKLYPTLNVSYIRQWLVYFISCCVVGLSSPLGSFKGRDSVLVTFMFLHTLNSCYRQTTMSLEEDYTYKEHESITGKAAERKEEKLESPSREQLSALRCNALVTSVDQGRVCLKIHRLSPDCLLSRSAWWSVEHLLCWVDCAGWTVLYTPSRLTTLNPSRKYLLHKYLKNYLWRYASLLTYPSHRHLHLILSQGKGSVTLIS